MSMLDEAAEIKSRVGIMMGEASDLIGKAKARHEKAGRPVPEFPLPEGREVIHSAMEAEYYAGMVILNDLPRDRDLAVRCLANAKYNLGKAESALVSARAALVKV